MNLLARFVRLPLRLVPRGMTVRILTGELRGWKWITGSATHGAWIGTYERETQRVFKTELREGDVVFDIGANAGFFSLLAAKLVGARGAVYAFEPLPQNLEYLRRHLVANHAEAVQVLPIALSSQSGVARFSSASNPAMGRLSDSGQLEVTTEPIDELVASERIRPPGFMKIDVEGAESDVLRGAMSVLRRHRPTLLLSTHGYREHERCCELLRSLAYELQIVRDGTIDGQYTVLATQNRSK